MSTALPNLAFHGLMGAGKSTVSELAVEHFGYTRISFAGWHPGGLRDVVSRVWGEEATQNRRIMQTMGMLVRKIDEDAWVNALARHLASEDAPPKPWVIDDLRFPNEAWFLKGEGFAVTRVGAGVGLRIQRLKANGKLQDESQLNHPSEGALKSWPDDWKIINERKTLPELLKEIGRIIEHESRSQ